MKTVLIPVAIASFFLVGFFGLFEKPDLVKPGEIVLPDSLKDADICYESHVRPIFTGSCSPCHIENNKAWVSLATKEGCVKNLDDAIRVIVKGKMPPGDRKKLNGSDVAILKAWKEKGLKICVP